MALVCASVAWGETLGDARQLSRLGEPLRLVIPVRPDGGPPVDERCLGVAGARQSDGLPHILTANVAVERDGNVRNVVVTTATAIREPVSRLVLRTTCDGASRQYTLFLEPPGSTRQIRSVAQNGPQLGAPGETQSTASGASGSNAARAPTTAAPASTPVVTVIPVVPGPTRPAGAPIRPPDSHPSPTIGSDSRSTPLIGAATASNSTQVKASAPETPEVAGSAPSSAAGNALEAENQTLKQQVAELNSELQRLQQTKADPGKRPLQMTATPDARAFELPRWENVWPVLVALAGLSALTAGGFLWRRRHSVADEWALTGPPSHRVASRTSLAEEPVTFRQVGVRADVATEGVQGPPSDVSVLVPTGIANEPRGAPPAALRLQPSTEDLARELEQELFVAERAHSALERAHPEIVDALTRSWGTAAARQHLMKLLEAGSAELARMSGEAVAELRLLLRVADDSFAPAPEQRPMPSTLTPPAPAW